MLKANLLNDAKFMNTSAVGWAAQAASILEEEKKKRETSKKLSDKWEIWHMNSTVYSKDQIKSSKETCIIAYMMNVTSKSNYKCAKYKCNIKGRKGGPT